MRGIWLEEGAVSLRDGLPVPTPGPAEALVRVVRAGICNTDLELVGGYYPYTGILGHEFAGVVEQGPDDLRGQRVVGEINATCGQCPSCRTGRRNHCRRRTVLGIVGRDGAFADYLSLPVDNLHRIPDSVSFDAATFTEPLAAALQIQEQLTMDEGDRILVVGDGKLGQLVAMSLALAGDVTVLGRHESKLSLLRECGMAAVQELAGEAEFDIVVECTGNPGGFERARAAVRSAGTLVLKSTYAGALTVDASALVVDEIRLIGSRCGPFAPALALLESGAVAVDRLISDRFRLRDGLDGFARARRRGVLKVLLDVADG